VNRRSGTRTDRMGAIRRLVSTLVENEKGGKARRTRVQLVDDTYDPACLCSLQQLACPSLRPGRIYSALIVWDGSLRALQRSRYARASPTDLISLNSDVYAPGSELRLISFSPALAPLRLISPVLRVSKHVRLIPPFSSIVGNRDHARNAIKRVQQA
jgi:hypothetical protein